MPKTFYIKKCVDKCSECPAYKNILPSRTCTESWVQHWCRILKKDIKHDQIDPNCPLGSKSIYDTEDILSLCEE